MVYLVRDTTGEPLHRQAMIRQAMTRRAPTQNAIARRAVRKTGSAAPKKARTAPASPDIGDDPGLRLVLTAARLFNEEGIHAVGINRIIAEAGVARMTLYNQFGSKEGLVRSVMERESKSWFEWLDSELARTAGQSARERIEAFFALHRQWFSRRDFKGCSFINAVGEHPLDNCVRQIANAHRQANFEYVRRLIENSEIDDLDKIANQITILADGATVTAMITGDHSMASAAAEVAISLLRPVSSDERRRNTRNRVSGSTVGTKRPRAIGNKAFSGGRFPPEKPVRPRP